MASSNHYGGGGGSHHNRGVSSSSPTLPTKVEFTQQNPYLVNGGDDERELQGLAGPVYVGQRYGTTSTTSTGSGHQNHSYQNYSQSQGPDYNPYTAPPPPTMHEQLIRERYNTNNNYNGNGNNYGNGNGYNNEYGGETEAYGENDHVVKNKTSGMMRKALKKVAL